MDTHRIIFAVSVKTITFVMLMEDLLHYVWKHRMFPLSEDLCTTEGGIVEVIDVGLHNYNQGPDFFNAKLKINGQQWVGNVEIHTKSSDWYLHNHDKDEAYNNVILHVVEKVDAETFTQNGNLVPQLVLRVPQEIENHYKELLSQEKYPPCHKIIPQIQKIKIRSFVTSLQVERLEKKTLEIEQRMKQSSGSWESGYFSTLARNYGFGHNGDAFELWAQSIPLSRIEKYKDNLFQIEAIFFGQAGMLEPEALSEKQLSAALGEGNYQKYLQEYRYLQATYGLTPLKKSDWKYMRMRPQNFPHLRVLQLAKAYHEGKTDVSKLLECATIEDVYKFLSTTDNNLSASSLNLIIINTIVPLFFAYGKSFAKQHLQDKAIEFLESLKPEENTITRTWKECGLMVENAADSQALVQLKKEYCDRKKCLYCRIGYVFLKGSTEKR